MSPNQIKQRVLMEYLKKLKLRRRAFANASLHSSCTTAEYLLDIFALVCPDAHFQISLKQITQKDVNKGFPSTPSTPSTHLLPL